MFLMVYPVEGAVAEKGRGRRKRFLPVQKMSVGRGLPFYAVPLPIEKGVPRWELVKQAAGGAAPRVVAPCGYGVPEGCGLGAYYPSAFAGRAVMKAALALLCRNPPAGGGITVWDEAGTGAADICRLLPLAGEVRVVTRCPQAYENARRRAMTEYGATLVFGEGRGRNDVLIHLPTASPGDGKYEILRRGESAVTACRYCPPFDGWALPPGTDSLAVAGAVSELCGLGKKAEGRFEQVNSPLMWGTFGE